jgi:hypothetical protein
MSEYYVEPESVWEESDYWEDYEYEEVEATPAEPKEPSALRQWAGEAGRGLVDVRFERSATKTLLPVVYILGITFAVVLPIALTVMVFTWSTLAGVVALPVAPGVIFCLVVVVRLAMEFFLSMARMSGKVGDLIKIAGELQSTMDEVVDPLHQITADFRAVQFWRFRARRETAQARPMRRAKG